jgi:hypothetical protein
MPAVGLQPHAVVAHVVDSMESVAATRLRLRVAGECYTDA